MNRAQVLYKKKSERQIFLDEITRLQSFLTSFRYQYMHDACTCAHVTYLNIEMYLNIEIKIVNRMGKVTYQNIYCIIYQWSRKLDDCYMQYAKTTNKIDRINN